MLLFHEAICHLPFTKKSNSLNKNNGNFYIYKSLIIRLTKEPCSNQKMKVEQLLEFTDVQEVKPGKKEMAKKISTQANKQKCRTHKLKK